MDNETNMLNTIGSMKDRMARAVITGVDAFVQSVGTAQCITGVAGALRKLYGAVHIAAAEPSESPVLAGGAPGPHKIEGVGPGFIPPIWTEGLSDEIIQISTSEAKDMARRLAREEALFAGRSTGANILAAIQAAGRLGAGHTVSTIACDTGRPIYTRLLKNVSQQLLISMN